MIENGFKKLSSKELIYFTSELQILLDSSIPPIEALEVLYKSAASKNIKNFCFILREKIALGLNFTNALKNYKSFLGDVYISLFKAGEESGKLPQILSYLTGFLKKQKELKMKFIKMSIYPICLTFGIIIMYFIFGGFVFPKFIETCDINIDDIPKLALFMISSVSFILNKWYFLLFGIFILFLLFKKSFNKEVYKQNIFNFLLKIPKINDCINYFSLVHYMTVLEVSYEAGVDIYESLFLAQETIYIKSIKNQAEKITKFVKKGNCISEAFLKFELISPVFTSMISTGEKTGRLGKIFKDISFAMEAKLNNCLEVLSKLFEPCTLIIIGIFIGIFAICFIKMYVGMLKSIF